MKYINKSIKEEGQQEGEGLLVEGFPWPALRGWFYFGLKICPGDPFAFLRAASLKSFKRGKRLKQVVMVIEQPELFT